MKDFEIERSADGTNWVTIHSIPANGSANNRYTSIDNSPFRNINNYRVKMNDKDGQFKYTPVRSVQFTDLNKFTVYPNPARSKTVIYFNNQ